MITEQYLVCELVFASNQACLYSKQLSMFDFDFGPKTIVDAFSKESKI